MLKIEDLYFKYNQDDQTPNAIDGVTLEIDRGDFVAVIGHNGCGKSTLAKHLNAILLPVSGKVYVSGMDTADQNLLYQIRHTCGMVFQNPDNQLVATTVEEDVAFGPENMGVPTQEIRQRIDEALKVVSMEGYMQHAPHMLSGGQKQRVAIAGIIAMQPRCIVFDEPTAMLDPVGRKEVLDTILKLNCQLGITIVLITHHMDEASLANRIVVMDKGKIHMDGTPKQIFARVDELTAVGLTAPQTVLLLDALKHAGVDVPLDAFSVRDCAQAIFERLEA